MSDKLTDEKIPTPPTEKPSSEAQPPSQPIQAPAAPVMSQPVPAETQAQKQAEKTAEKVDSDKPIPVESPTPPITPNTPANQTPILPTRIPSATAEPPSQPLQAPTLPVAPAAPASVAQASTPAPTPPITPNAPANEPALVVSEAAARLPDVENPYVLDQEIDRARLVAQGRLFSTYVEKHAKEYAGDKLKRILDIGCSEGWLTQAFARLYPDAEVIGVDIDEKAIQEAKRTATAKKIRNLKFEVHDVTKSLPAGPFDLVYESLAFQHLRGLPQMLKAVYDVLSPGGFLWMKDLEVNFETYVDHPAYKRFAGWGVKMLDMSGQDWRFSANLAPILTSAGLNPIRSEVELYPIGNIDTNARITMAVHLGAFYNSRKAISRFLNVPAEEIVKTHMEIVEAMLAPGGPTGIWKYVNTVSQKPEAVAPVTPT